jgi:folate-binding protein YgfZ
MNANEIKTFELEGYTVLKIGGADRRDFLQGQLTQDVTRVTAQQSLLAGWTTAKGRLLAVGQLIDWGDAFYLPLPSDTAPGVAQRLGMFVLRAEVSIELVDMNIAGLAVPADSPIDIGNLHLPNETGACVSDDSFCLARIVDDPSRAWALGDIPADLQGGQSSEAWKLANVQAGIPEIVSGASEQFTPQMLNLDLLGGISFTKGCYVGQEIVARTQNLGRIKRRMYRFHSDSDSPLASGDLLHGPEAVTGKVVAGIRSNDGTEMLAVVAIDSASGDWYSDEECSAPIQLRELPYDIPDQGP